MADIFHDLPIAAPVDRVFTAVSTPAGLDAWWTKRSAGHARRGVEYELWFGPEYDWRARVATCAPPSAFELEMTKASDDWCGTRIRFQLESTPSGTQLRFSHSGWPAANEHYRISCYCWAMYLRILKRSLECGESVSYERRLEV